MRRAAVLLTAIGAALWSSLSPAAADDTVVVRGLAFPSSDTYLTYFGCADLFHLASAPPQVRIGQAEATPTGLRSFGVQTPGAGTASGPVTLVDSVAATTVAGFSARADLGSTGVAYVWYVSPGIDRGQVWAGRADLAVGPQWQYVDAAAATYRWTLYDVDKAAAVRAGGSATIAGFTAENGDGPGYLLAGLGCDGTEFVIDALRFGSPGAVTTYDLEGITVTTSISACRDRAQREAGDLHRRLRRHRRRTRRCAAGPPGPPGRERGLPSGRRPGRRVTGWCGLDEPGPGPDDDVPLVHAGHRLRRRRLLRPRHRPRRRTHPLSRAR